MKSWVGLGLMSGTSLDGLDLAACRFWEEAGRWHWEIIAAETLPYDEKWFARLACLADTDALSFAKTHIYFGRFLGKSARDFLESHSIRADFVASHGQTVFHQPEKNLTVQIGDGETLVSFLTCPLVTNFRAKDVALGGQGAPLVPFGERHLFPETSLFLNLGGFANLSFQNRAFDIGACNLALNFLAQRHNPDWACDRGGEMARSGKFLPGLFERLEAIPFYAQTGPKSLGTEWFLREVLPILGEEGLHPADAAHTYVHHLAHQIGRACREVGAGGHSLLATGGGCHHSFLREVLKETLGKEGFSLLESPPLLVDFKEALVFAFLGLCVLRGIPNTLATVTGAPFDVAGGSIHVPPRGWKNLLD